MDKEFLDNKTETSGCTLDEYKYVYPRLMNKHITTGVPGRNELQFIRREIENHAIILEGLKKTMLKISDFDYRRENFDPIEVNFGQEKFLNTMASFENMRDNHELIIEYLETKKSVLEKGSRTATATKDVNENKLTVDQLALKMVYEGVTMVTREKYGDDLYNKFSHWSKRANRTANDGTDRQLNNKIERFEKVIEALSPEDKQQAINEVKILKSYLTNK